MELDILGGYSGTRDILAHNTVSLYGWALQLLQIQLLLLTRAATQKSF